MYVHTCTRVCIGVCLCCVCVCVCVSLCVGGGSTTGDLRCRIKLSVSTLSGGGRRSECSHSPAAHLIRREGPAQGPSLPTLTPWPPAALRSRSLLPAHTPLSTSRAPGSRVSHPRQRVSALDADRVPGSPQSTRQCHVVPQSRRRRCS
jgi:hypothetical protein